jgi:hypothetical protein
LLLNISGRQVGDQKRYMGNSSPHSATTLLTCRKSKPGSRGSKMVSCPAKTRLAPGGQSQLCTIKRKLASSLFYRAINHHISYPRGILTRNGWMNCIQLTIHIRNDTSKSVRTEYVKMRGLENNSYHSSWCEI